MQRSHIVSEIALLRCPIQEQRDMTKTPPYIIAASPVF